MKNDDWKSALADLAAGLPAVEETDASVNEPDAPEGDCPAQTGALLVTMERKGRGGKTATIISGFTMDDAAVAQLASRLKTRLGTGGSSRGGEILIQGDRRADVAAALRGYGFKVKGC